MFVWAAFPVVKVPTIRIAGTDMEKFLQSKYLLIITGITPVYATLWIRIFDPSHNVAKVHKQSESISSLWMRSVFKAYAITGTTCFTLSYFAAGRPRDKFVNVQIAVICLDLVWLRSRKLRILWTAFNSLSSSRYFVSSAARFPVTQIAW